MTSGDVRLAVRDHGGPATGPQLLLVHGLASNLEIWDPVASRLRGRFRVVAYDQRTHGRSSDGADYAYPALVGDLRAVASARGLRSPVVVGHSWGASVAVHHAATSPDCPGIVCVDGGVVDLKGMGLAWPDAESRLRPPHLEGTPDEILATIRAHQTDVEWEHAEPVLRRSFVVGGDGIMRRRTPVAEHMRIVREMWDEPVWERYAAIRCPVLVVLARHRGDDPFRAARERAVERLHASGADLRVEWLDSPHDIPIARPDELAELIAGFAGEAD